MPKAPKNIALILNHHNTPAGELADAHGQLGIEIAELELQRKAIAAELIRRGVRADGTLFQSIIVSETTTTTVDRAAIERDMGEGWLAQYLKWSRRSASVRTTARAAAVARLAA